VKLTPNYLKKLIKEELEEGRFDDMKSKVWKYFKHELLGMSKQTKSEMLNRYNKVVQLAVKQLKTGAGLEDLFDKEHGMFKKKLDYGWGLEDAPKLIGAEPFDNEFKHDFQRLVWSQLFIRNENPENIPFYNMQSYEDAGLAAKSEIEEEKDWIQGSDLKKGRCTPMGTKECPEGSPQYNLAKRFKSGDVHKANLKKGKNPKGPGE